MKVRKSNLRIVPLAKSVAVYTDIKFVPKDQKMRAKTLDEYVKSKTSSYIESLEAKNEEIEDLKEKIEYNGIAFDELKAQIEEMPKQNRYLQANDDKMDFIDASYRDMPFEQFVGAMRFTIGKYFSRFGRKDDIVEEARKIADYANRFYQKVQNHQALNQKD